MSIEAPDTIVPVGRNTPPVGAGALREGGAPGPFSGNAVTPAGAALSGKASRIMAAALLGAGVILGIAGLFPAYIGGKSLAQQPEPGHPARHLPRRLDRERCVSSCSAAPACASARC